MLRFILKHDFTVYCKAGMKSILVDVRSRPDCKQNILSDINEEFILEVR